MKIIHKSYHGNTIRTIDLEEHSLTNITLEVDGEEFELVPTDIVGEFQVRHIGGPSMSRMKRIYVQPQASNVIEIGVHE